MTVAETPDLLRLLAVPVLGWAAYRDVRTRRVPTRTWYPLVALGVVLLAWEGWRVYAGEAASTPFARRLFVLRVGVSLGVVAPFAYLVWRVGGFGGADAKALIALAVLVPAFPTYVLAGGADGALVLPTRTTPLGVFSMTVLTNTVLLAAAYPAFLAVYNLASGDRSRAMVVGRRVPCKSVPDRHGSLLETPDGFTRRGLDVDALRMYLRWRGVDLADLRVDPDRYRDPASLPPRDERGDPGDGAIAADGGDPGGEGATATDSGDPVGREDGVPGGETRPDDAAGRQARPDADRPDGLPPDVDAADDRLPPDVDPDDEWGAEAFLADLEWGAWGTAPADLRAGLEVLTGREAVWYSPGIPFLVPMFLGLVVGLTYGDLLFGVLSALGLA